MKSKTKTMAQACMICGSPMELIVRISTTEGHKYLCLECAKTLYGIIGKKLIPTRPTNLFKTKK